METRYYVRQWKRILDLQNCWPRRSEAWSTLKSRGRGLEEGTRQDNHTTEYNNKFPKLRVGIEWKRGGVTGLVDTVSIV